MKPQYIADELVWREKDYLRRQNRPIWQFGLIVLGVLLFSGACGLAIGWLFGQI